MQTNTNNIRVSMFPELVRADMKVTQNDIDTNEVIVRVFDQSDVEIDYATITSALIIFTKPDYHVVQGNMEVRENDLYYKMGTNEIACQGTVKAQIQLVGSSGERLTIGGFSFTVQPDPVTPWTVQSSSEYGILYSLIVEAQAAINDVDALSLWENYNPTKPYIPLNKVVYNGSCYINFVACQGVLPTDASKWLKIASRGEDGADGKDGADGTDGIDATITIGTVTTGAAGTSASVNNVGTPSNAVFNFSIPKGDKGDKGETGEVPDITIGTVTTVPAGTSASVTRRAGSPDESPIFDFDIPKGVDGEGAGDMIASVYDPNNKQADAFSMENMVESTTKKIMTADERTKLTGIETGANKTTVNNTLTSTSETEALSAAQGKILKDAQDAHKAENEILIPKAESTANAIVLDIVLTDKKKGSFRAVANNTGNMTINGEVFKKDATTEIPADGVKSNKVYDFYYDETADCVFILAKTSGNAQPSHVLAPYTFSNDDGEQIGTAVDASLLSPGNIAIASSLDDSLTSNTGWTKLKEIKIQPQYHGIVRARYGIRSTHTAGAYEAHTFINGVLYEDGNNPGGSTQTKWFFSHDIPVESGDLVQVYARITRGSQSIIISDFTIGVALSIATVNM